MPRCKECLHYEVCAKEGRLVQIDEHTWDEYNQLDDVERFCNNYIADVVPKSEYDKAILLLEEEIAELKNRIFPSYCQACSEDEAIEIGKKYGRQEAASEIFAEIEKEIDLKLSVTKEFLQQKGGRTAGKTIIQTRFNVLNELDKYFAELKKKYTEG